MKGRGPKVFGQVLNKDLRLAKNFWAAALCLANGHLAGQLPGKRPSRGPLPGKRPSRVATVAERMAKKS
jgi:hypothetical protein